MKTIKQIQEESRKIIILANNAEAKSYNEALLLELGCTDEFAKKADLWGRKIIGKPLTLSRVLIALESKIGEEDIIRFNIKKEYKAIFFEKDGFGIIEMPWNLTKETLEEQTEEVQRAINELLKHD